MAKKVQAVVKKSNAGRKPKAEEDRVGPVVFYAKNKNHEVIVDKLTPLVKKLDKN